MCTFVADIFIILLWIVYGVSRAGYVFFGMILMAVYVPGLNSICQSFSHCSSDDWSDYCCWSLSVVMLLKRIQSLENNFGRRDVYKRRWKLWDTPDVKSAWLECIFPAGPPQFCWPKMI